MQAAVCAIIKPTKVCGRVSVRAECGWPRSAIAIRRHAPLRSCMSHLPLVRFVTLALLVALVAPLGAPQSQAASELFVMRVYFRSTAERDRLLATLDVPDHAVQPEGYLLAYGDQPQLDRLRSAGQRAEIDAPRTRAERRSTAALFYQGYHTVEQVYADLDALVTSHPNIAATVDAGDSWCKTQGGCILP